MHTVLVVEPSPAVRSAIIDLIQLSSARHSALPLGATRPITCHVVQAKDGHEALLQLPRASYDLVIVNEDLPDISGFSVLSFVRKNPASQHIPVVMVAATVASEATGNQATVQHHVMGDQQGRSHAHALGATAFMAQPLDATLLRETIAAMLSGRRHG